MQSCNPGIQPFQSPWKLLPAKGIENLVHLYFYFYSLLHAALSKIYTTMKFTPEFHADGYVWKLTFTDVLHKIFYKIHREKFVLKPLLIKVASWK